MKYKEFEDYLKEQHGKNYRGLDDDMPDAYEKWVTELDLTTVMELADDYSHAYAFQEMEIMADKMIKSIGIGYKKV